MDALADRARAVAERCADPKIAIHFMSARVAEDVFVSAELTAFLRRAPRCGSDALRDLGSAVFGSSGLVFQSPQVLVAQLASSLRSDRTLYLSLSDSLGSTGYVLFDSGALSAFELLGWGGSDTYVNSSGATECEGGRAGVLTRAAGRLSDGLRLESEEDVFSLFYGKDAKVRSFWLKEGRRLLDRPVPVDAPSGE